MKAARRSLRVVLVCAMLAPLGAWAADAGPRPVPSSLPDQVSRLAQLLRDAHASEHAEGRKVQRIRRPQGGEIVLVLLTLEGFGGGNGYAQYLAAFEADADDPRRAHHALVDAMLIGGRGWRTVESLNVQAQFDRRSGEMTFALDVMENAASDAPNFPSRRSTLGVSLKDGRFALRQQR